MIITWKPCSHVRYTSDDEDQSGWQYLQVQCPDCGLIGTNVQDGKVDYVYRNPGTARQTTDMGPGGYGY